MKTSLFREKREIFIGRVGKFSKKNFLYIKTLFRTYISNKKSIFPLFLKGEAFLRVGKFPHFFFNEPFPKPRLDTKPDTGVSYLNHQPIFIEMENREQIY